jgi:hypothetical protein
MREGVTPTTDRVTLIVHGERATSDRESRRARAAHPPRRQVARAGAGRHARGRTPSSRTTRCSPRTSSPAPTWSSSSPRPTAPSPRANAAFLQRIASWGKKVTIVVNKADLLEDAGERDEVLAFVRSHARDRSATTPDVSRRRARRVAGARRGRRRRRSPSRPPWRRAASRPDGSWPNGSTSTACASSSRPASGWPGTSPRRRSRRSIAARPAPRRPPDPRRRRPAAGPVGQGRRARGPCLPRPHQDRAARGRAPRRGLLRRHRPVGPAPHPAAAREGARTAFEERVLRGAASEIDDAVASMSDWFVERTLQQWEDVVGFVAERRKAGDERVVGEVGGRFRYDRAPSSRRCANGPRACCRATTCRGSRAAWPNRCRRACCRPGCSKSAASGWGRRRRPGDHDRLGHHRHRGGPHRDGARVDGAAAPQGEGEAPAAPADAGLARRPRGGPLGRQLDEEVQRANERLTGAVAPYTRFVRRSSSASTTLAAEVGAASASRIADLRSEAAQLGPATD